MAYIVIYEGENDCFIAENEAEVIKKLEEYDWPLADCTIYEQSKPIEFEIKLVRKQTLVRKEK